MNIFTEDHAALTGARDIVIANELQPEESTNINFNLYHWFQRKDHHTSIDLDLFYTHFSNKIVPNYNTDPTKIIYDNLKDTPYQRGIFSNSHSFSIPLNISLGGTT